MTKRETYVRDDLKLRLRACADERKLHATATNSALLDQLAIEAHDKGWTTWEMGRVAALSPTTFRTRLTKLGRL